MSGRTATDSGVLTGKRAHLIRDSAQLWLFFVPAALVVITQLVLIGWTGLLSGQDWVLRTSQVAEGWVGAENYRAVLADPIFRRAVRNSLIITSVSVPVQLALGVGLAYLVFPLRRARWIRTGLVLPMVLAPVSVGVLWRLMFNTRAGPVNAFILGSLGLDGPIWLGDPWWALAAVIIVEIWEWTPFVLLLAAAALTAVPQDIRDSAAVDGASAWQRIRRVEIPIMMPVLLIITLFRTLESLISLDVIISLTRGGPGYSTFTLPYYIYDLGLKSFDLGRASAASWLFMLVALVVSIALVRAQSRATS